jgi:hypothetical protein
MTTRFRAPGFVCTLAICLFAIPYLVVGQPLSPTELRMTAARVSITGTSNIYPFTASTTDVRLSRLVLAPAEGNRLQAAATPGGVTVFEIVIPAASLATENERFDELMHKGLKVAEYPDITFRLARLEAGTAANSLTVVALLKIAGVEREVTFAVKAAVNASTITVMGEVDLLMTDYGIAPPTAMLGMLRADPKITVTFDTVFAIPQVTTLY